MSRKDAFKVLFSMVMCLVAGGCAIQAAEENRYKSWIEEGVLSRFDNQTGEICKLVKPAAGSPVWVKVDVLDPKPAVAKAPRVQSAPLPSATPPAYIRADAVAVIDNPVTPEQNPAKPIPVTRQIHTFDGLDNEITDRIDDSDRAACRAVINGYDGLHVSHTLKTSGDRIKGIIILDNKGQRKINLLELTMTVRVIGKDKPVEYKRFILADKPDGEKPPVPSFGSSGMSVLKTIDVPTPSGVINGMPEVRISYIRFDDKE